MQWPWKWTWAEHGTWQLVLTPFQTRLPPVLCLSRAFTAVLIPIKYFVLICITACHFIWA